MTAAAWHVSSCVMLFFLPLFLTSALDFPPSSAQHPALRRFLYLLRAPLLCARLCVSLLVRFLLDLQLHHASVPVAPQNVAPLTSSSSLRSILFARSLHRLSGRSLGMLARSIHASKEKPTLQLAP